MSLGTLLIILLPATFWLAYIAHQDRVQPKPLRDFLLTVGLGVCAGAVSVMLYAVVEWFGAPTPEIVFSGGRAERLFYALLVIGPIEEAAKLVPFCLFCVYFRSFRRPLDGVVFASAIGVGFALYESAGLRDVEASYRIGAALMLPLLHMLFASVWAYAYAWARAQGRSRIKATVFGGLLAAGLHGLYDFFALDPQLVVWATVLAVGLWLWRVVLVRSLLDRSGRSHHTARAATNLA